MEDRPAGSSPSVGAGAESSPASAEPATSRRRAGGHKRKATALSSSGGSSSAPSKRLTREKAAAAAAAAAAAISHSPIHNGPLTRASRLSPGNLASAASPAAAGNAKLEEKAAAAALGPDVTAAVEEERSKLEAAMEAEFESIRSRDSNAHVVPSHCGWFSWSKVHPLEERSLPSFFNGKSQIRTPDAYIAIRNWIVKKFHMNPNIQIELKDLSELGVADMDARQEVFEFLDYWGLINFHPSLGAEAEQGDVVADADGDGTTNIDSLLEKLFRFEAIQPCEQVIPKPNVATPAVPSGLFPETAFAEEMARLEGPAVEYHCNSCSADCSRKRYHCQKQADYDLCADCFNNGKFGSNMSSSDFILMEPADGPGLSGGKWTDQETLLLLEALELYKENWTEIAEHVATKTKAQCILHFVQMPIEDAFFDMGDDIDGSPKETADPDVTIDGTSASKDVTETSEDKTCSKEDQPQASPVEASKPEGSTEAKVSQETAKPGNKSEAVIGQETLKPEVTSEVKAGKEINENVALRALNEAFEAIGYHPTPENHLSFAEVGNPVMALAAFLARLVGADAATAAARSSLKSLFSKTPGINLAARHCFLLENPPDENKKQSGVDGIVAEIVEGTALNNNHEEANQKENESVGPLDGKESPNDQADKKNDDSVAEEKKPQDSSNGKSMEKVNAETEETIINQSEPGNLMNSSNSDLPMDVEKESDEKPSKVDYLPTSSKDTLEGSSGEEQLQLPEAAETVNMVSDSNPSEKNDPCQSVTMTPAEEPAKVVQASTEADMIPDSLASDKNEPQQTGNCSQPADTAMDKDMTSSLASQVQEPQQPTSPNSVVENGAIRAEDLKDDKKEKPNCEVIKDDDNIDIIKRAAVSTLSAAAVKAKLLANQEEDQIRQLTALLIEKQLHKLESKLGFFNEMDGVITRVKEQLERSRQKLYVERAQIIAARLGLPASSSRAMPPSLPANRIAMNFANSVARPPMGMTPQRPPIARPVGTLSPTPSNPFVSTSSAGNSIGPGQDKLSSVGTK